MSILEGRFKTENEERRKRMHARADFAHGVDYKQFVQVWMKVYEAGGNRINVCEELDITYEAMASRASMLTKRGVNLPKLTRSSEISRLQVDDLNSLVGGVPEQPHALKKPPVV